MNDRDSLFELFEIVLDYASHRQLHLTAAALPYIRERFGMGCDIYYRRRLSVCRMLIDLHLPISLEQLDILLAAALSHFLPGDKIPADHMEIVSRLFADEPRVAEVMATLRHTDYGDKSYYTRLVANRYALMIRLTERGVLVEKLYEWDPADARRYIRETREHFFPMCIYAKEHYPELLGAASILMEKMRNLIVANEALLNRYEDAETSLRGEILALREENVAIRSMISTLQDSE